MAVEKVRKQKGLTRRQVMENRRRLTEVEWIRFEVCTVKGRKIGTWFIGKEVVQARIDSTTTLEEFNHLGIITDEEYKIVQSLESEEDSTDTDK